MPVFLRCAQQRRYQICAEADAHNELRVAVAKSCGCVFLRTSLCSPAADYWLGQRQHIDTGASHAVWSDDLPAPQYSPDGPQTGPVPAI